jgi:hypothetical protein
MKVYIVLDCVAYEGAKIEKVFSTYEAAETYIQKEYPDNSPMGYEWKEIETCEVEE